MPKALLLAGPLAAALVLGCETTPEATSAETEATTPPAPVVSTALGDPESPTGGVVTDADGFRVAHDDWARLGYQWDWNSRPLISPRGQVTFFDAAGDLVIAQESGSNVSVFEARTGRMLWTSQMGTRFTDFVGPVRDADLILISSASELFELGATTGNLVDKERLKFLVNNRPVLMGNMAIYPSDSGKILAHNRDAGVFSWAYALDGPITHQPTVVGDRLVAAVSEGGDVIFLNPYTGASAGRNKVSAGVTSRPVADTDRLYFGSMDQSVYAFDADGGELAWRVRTEFPIDSQAALHEGVVFLSLKAHGMTAFDTIDGELIWRNDEIHGEVIGVRNGELLVWDGMDLALLDPERGDVIRRHSFPGAAMVTTDAFIDGAVYVVGRSGVIVRFVPRS